MELGSKSQPVAGKAAGAVKQRKKAAIAMAADTDIAGGIDTADSSYFVEIQQEM